MGHQFDDFLKKKLDEREFEFNEAYWANALELIEADEKNDKKPFIYWLLLGLLLLPLAWYLTQQWQKQPSLAPTTSVTVPSATEPVVSSSTASTTPPPAQTEPPANDTQKSFFDQKNTSNSSNSDHSTHVQDKLLTQQTTPSNPKSSYELNQATGGATAATLSKQAVATHDASTTTDPTFETTFDTPITDAEASHKPKSPTMLSPTQPIETLACNPLTSTSGLSAPSLPPLSAIDPLPAVPGSSPFSLGVRASSLLYLAIDGQIGYTGGLTARYELAPQWAVGGDLLYHVRRHQFGAVDQNSLIDYGFGRTEAQQLLRPSAIHSFEMPLWLAYRFGNGLKTKDGQLNLWASERHHKHGIELGVAPIWMYGTRGYVATADAEETALEEGWIATDVYRNFYINALVGYNYYPKKNLSVGIRARYALGGIIRHDFELPNTTEGSQPDNLYFDINAKFYLY